MPFKLESKTQLSPPTLFTTVEETVGEGRAAFGKAPFQIVEVREATLSDFFNVTTLAGDLRESMQEKSGDSSPMDAVSADNIGLLESVVGDALNGFAAAINLNLSGLLIRGKVREIAGID